MLWHNKAMDKGKIEAMATKFSEKFAIIMLKKLLSNNTKNVSIKAMHLTNVNFVIKDLMEKQIL